MRLVDKNIVLRALDKVDVGIVNEFRHASNIKKMDLLALAVCLIRGAQMGRSKESINFHDFDQLEHIDRFIKSAEKSLKNFKKISSQYSIGFKYSFDGKSYFVSYEDMSIDAIKNATVAKNIMKMESVHSKKLRRGRRPSHAEDLCLAALAKLFRYVLGDKETSLEYAGIVASHCYRRRGGALSSSSMRKKLEKFGSIKKKDLIPIENHGVWAQDFSKSVFDLRFPHKMSEERNDFEKAAAYLEYPLCYLKMPRKQS